MHTVGEPVTLKAYFASSVSGRLKNSPVFALCKIEYPTYSKKKEANWIGHILRRYYTLKYIIEGKIGGIEETEDKE
jgi:hypothetical protein